LKEIASRLGISVSTVSRALAGRPGPGETLRAEIIRVAESMGGPGRSRWAVTALRKATVVIWRQYLLDSNNDFFNAVYDGIRREAAAQGVILESVLLDRDKAIPDRIPQILVNSQGIISLGIDGASWLDWLSAIEKPVVICSGKDRSMRFDSVVPAWRDGARLAARHLIDLGHRNIAFVGALDRTASHCRLEGFMDAMKEAGLCFDRQTNLVEIVDGGAEAVRSAFLGDLNGRLAKASAVFCAPDSAAMGLISACLETGISVPGDVSVVGFDDMPTAALFHPGITSVHVDRPELGRMAFRRLAARTLHPDEVRTNTELGVSLVVRSSTAAAP